MMRYKPEYDFEALEYDKSRFSDTVGMYIDTYQKQIIHKLLMKKNSDKILLDLGVGTGRFSLMLSKQGYNVVGVDISLEMIKQTKLKNSNIGDKIHLLQTDVHYLPFRKGKIHTCTCINVVNHLRDVSIFLKEVNFVSEKEGEFIINFHNLLSIYFPFALIVNLTKRSFFNRNITAKWFTPKEVYKLMHEAGFFIDDIKGCMIITPLIFSRLLTIIQIINDKFEKSRYKFLSGNLFVRACAR